jgi:hypothetical protein
MSRKYADTAGKFYYKDQIMGKWARVDLVFTPKSKKLYTLSINWSGQGVSNKSGFSAYFIKFQTKTGFKSVFSQVKSEITFS